MYFPARLTSICGKKAKTLCRGELRRYHRAMTDAQATADLFTLVPGNTPLLVNVPHAGLGLAPGLKTRLTQDGQTLADTDWHVGRLYDFVTGLGAGLMVAAQSRYVVALNSDPGGRALYPGADNTEICPTRRFHGAPLYREGELPDDAEIAARVAHYWRPYHDRSEERLVGKGWFRSCN